MTFFRTALGVPLKIIMKNLLKNLDILVYR